MTASSLTALATTKRLNVNPTRMELKRLKTRLKMAERGHKLLKDKSDEMVRRFMEFANQNKALREQVEKEFSLFAIASPYAVDLFIEQCSIFIFIDI